MINYYHRFIPHCANKFTPLNQLLTAANEGHTRLSPKSNFDLKWNKSANSPFIESKQILATLLVHLDHSAPLNITCDASDFAVGGVLQQYIDNVCVTTKAVGFYRRVHNRHKICERRGKFRRRRFVTIDRVLHRQYINHKL